MKTSLPLHKRRLCLDALNSEVRPLLQEENHYLQRVLRLQSGETIEVFDGKGQFASAVLKIDNKKTASLDISKVQTQKKQGPRLTVALATPKRERADWVVEKLAELGVYAIQWIDSTRSVRVSKKLGERQSRWLRIAQAAVGQSGGYHVPLIHDAIELNRFLDKTFSQKFLGGFPAKMLTSEVTSLQPVDSHALLIGPEGGFTAEEIQKALDAGYLKRQLGQHILRTETAAIVGASILGSIG